MFDLATSMTKFAAWEVRVHPLFMSWVKAQEISQLPKKEHLVGSEANVRTRLREKKPNIHVRTVAPAPPIMYYIREARTPFNLTPLKPIPANIYSSRLSVRLVLRLQTHGVEAVI